MSDVELLPTVVLEHARTGQPIVVDQRDYLARRNGRYADWRLLGQGDFIAPPPLPSEESRACPADAASGGAVAPSCPAAPSPAVPSPAVPSPAVPSPAVPSPAAPPPVAPPPAAARRRGRRRRSRA